MSNPLWLRGSRSLAMFILPMHRDTLMVRSHGMHTDGTLAWQVLYHGCKNRTIKEAQAKEEILKNKEKCAEAAGMLKKFIENMYE